MPFSIERHAAVISVTLSGAVGLETLSDIAEVLDQIDRETPGLNRLVETAEVTGVILDFATMVRFADERRRRSPAEFVRTAIVAPANVTFGYGRMFQDLLQQRITVHVFRTRDEATAWLEEPKEPRRPEWRQRRRESHELLAAAKQKREELERRGWSTG